MSHELRTPLNAIIGFAELLLLRDVEHRKQRRGYVADIPRARICSPSSTTSSTVRSSRADHLSLGKMVFDLGRFLEDSVRLVGVQAEATGVTLHRPAPPSAALKGDERRLRQCVVNSLWEASAAAA